MKRILLSKSKNHLTDEDIKTLGGEMNFVSFEQIVQNERKRAIEMNQESNVKGYRVTEQGIEILWDK